MAKQKESYVYNYVLYKDSAGNEPLREFFETIELEASRSKSRRIRYNKIKDYLILLCTAGTRIGEPVTKYLRDGLWELRPLDDRIILAHWQNGIFVLLHQFVKDGQKTPSKEIDKALAFLKDWKGRND